MPRAGSTSITRAVSEVVHKRDRATATWAFTFIRHPFDRLMSAYMRGKSSFPSQPFADWFSMELAAGVPFMDMHVKPQALLVREWLDKHRRDRLDFIGDFHDIDVQWSVVQAVDPEVPHVGHMNKSAEHPEWTATDYDWKSIVPMYREDFALSGQGPPRL